MENIATEKNGTAWDVATNDNWMTSFFETMKRSLLKPVSFFSDVAEGQGLLKPWLYAIIIYAVVFVIAASYKMGFTALSSRAEIEVYKSGLFLFATTSIPQMLLGIAFCTVTVLPVVATAGLFVSAGVCHICLSLVGGAKKSYETTFRVICYSAAPQIFQLVPFLGFLAAGVWNSFLAIVGLKVAHETTYGKSALAVFLPVIVCCGGFLFVVVSLAGGITAGIIKSFVH